MWLALAAITLAAAVGCSILEHFPSALNRGDSQPLSPRRIWGKLIRLGS